LPIRVNLSRAAFNASPSTTHPTEAQLYREAARRSGLQAFDEMESLRGGGDKDWLATLIAAREADDEAGSAARLITALQKVAADVGMAATPTRLLEALQGNGYAWVKSTRRLAGLLAPLGLVARPGRENGRPVRLYTLDPGVLADLARRYNPAVGAASENGSSSLSEPAECVDNRQQASTAP